MLDIIYFLFFKEKLTTLSLRFEIENISTIWVPI